MLAVPGILIGSIMGTIISYCLQSKGWSVFAFIVSLCGACLLEYCLFILVFVNQQNCSEYFSNFRPEKSSGNCKLPHSQKTSYYACIFSENQLFQKQKKISIDHFIIGTVRSYIFPCSKLSEFF